jgi:hypothetical protein
MIVQRVDTAERSAKTALAAVGQKRQDPLCEKGLTIARQFAGHEERAEAAIREQDRRFGIEEQSVVTRA